MRFGTNVLANRADYRKYNSENRKVWKDLGFRQCSSQVHDDDREVMLAQMEVLRYERLALASEDDGTPTETLATIATRNMYSPPSKEELRDLHERAVKSKARQEIQDLVESCRHFLRKYTNVKNNFDPEAEYSKRIRAEAKGLAFMNLAIAYHRLGVAKLHHAGATSVFGMKDED